MSDQRRHVLERALRLPEDERATLIAELLHTLDEATDEGLSKQEWEDAWAAEIERRIREIRNNSVELIDGDEVLHQVRAGLKPDRQ